MKRKFNLISIIFICLIIAFSCKEEELLTLENGDNTILSKIQYEEDEMVELGERINDPYSLENIQNAYNELKSGNKNIPQKDIKATHHYIRFLPRNDEELFLLTKDTNLIIFDFPLHYEIKNKGTFYHDPSLKLNQITWQYSVIPVKYKYPKNIKHELIYKVHIPSEGDPIFSNKSITKAKEFNNMLEYTSFLLTNNVDTTKNKLKSTKGLFDRWTPEGIIQVHDDVVGGLIPLEGAKVQVRWSVNIDECLTNSNGYFEMKDYLFEVNYSIKWERNKWDIRHKNIGQAWYNGPKMAKDWYLNIESKTSLGYATIHRAAYRMFKGNNNGLPRNLDVGKIKYAYFHHEEGTGSYIWSTNKTNIELGIWPDIKIYGQNSTGRRSTDELFSTVSHENGHALHLSKIGGRNYFNVDKIIRESWADAVELSITKLEYNDLGFPHFEDPTNPLFSTNSDNKQDWNNSDSNIYTPLFIDLVPNRYQDA